MPLGDGLQTGALRYPDKQALIVEERTWTYAEFDDITTRMARSA